MQDVFSAVADPVRREIIQRLGRSGPLSIREIADELPFTRQATSKHLAILAEAGLVAKERHGREQRHRLTPEPFEEMQAWLDRQSARWDRRLERLQTHLEQGA